MRLHLIVNPQEFVRTKNAFIFTIPRSRFDWIEKIVRKHPYDEAENLNMWRKFGKCFVRLQPPYGSSYIPQPIRYLTLSVWESNKGPKVMINACSKAPRSHNFIAMSPPQSDEEEEVLCEFDSATETWTDYVRCS
jgi:hypothetical protein